MSSSARFPLCRLLSISGTAPSRQIHTARNLSSTRLVYQEELLSPDAATSLDDLAVLAKGGAEGDAEPTVGDIKYDEWIATEGQKWKNPDPLGPKWLGGAIPFPLNPTFRPPAPVSDALRTTIYSALTSNPKENDVRTLSARYGLSMQRIEAIVRLKELEEQWKKSKPLQTGFLQGMERVLGLNGGGKMTPIAEELKSVSLRDMATSDEMSRQVSESGRGEKRGVSTTYFEPIDENKPPLVPRLLEELKLQCHASRAQRMEYPSTVVQPDPAKAAYRFVDVGRLWANRTDMQRRVKESVRRKAIKAARKKVDRDYDKMEAID